MELAVRRISPPLAPVASYEGLIVAANLLKGNHQRPNYLGVPSVVFTIPPLAAVGLSERGAREQNLKFRVAKEVTSTLYSSRRVAETRSGYKVLVEEGTDRILGAHILGSEAGEVIDLFALAIRSGMRGTDLEAHAVCVSDEWLKYDAHALEGSKADDDTVHSNCGAGVRSKQVSETCWIGHRLGRLDPAWLWAKPS